MKDYDFSDLNDKEFENLFLDLLQEEEGLTIERFKQGKDQGIDGRYLHKGKELSIVQCKHYRLSGYSKLKSSLKNTELKKVQTLNPERYIVATTVGLTPPNKKEIKDIFEPFIKSTNDIYGLDDINALIKKYPKVELNYYKLWIASTNILYYVLNNKVHERSKHYARKLIDKSKYTVETSLFKNAEECLSKNHVIIITGDPGVGKTTLAEYLSAIFMGHGYQFFFINSIEEGEDVFQTNEKQIFLFDDFLGTNLLEIIEDKLDTKSVEFLNRVKEDSYKRIIYTTRSNIFSSALSISEVYDNENISKDEYLYDIKQISLRDKTIILYNHLWHSNLPLEYIEELYKEKSYLEIINHKNYNPRLISQITQARFVIDIDPEIYVDTCIKFLDDPKKIWDKFFKQQISELSRLLILLVVFNNGRISEKSLKDSYSLITDIYAKEKTLDCKYKEAIQPLLDRMLVRDKYENFKLCNISVYNPSLSDYIIFEYKDNSQLLSDLFLSLKTINSLDILKPLYSVATEPKEIVALARMTMGFEDVPVGYRLKAVYVYLNIEKGTSLDDIPSTFWDVDFSEIRNINFGYYFYLLEKVYEAESKSTIGAYGKYIKILLSLDFDTLDSEDHSSLLMLFSKYSKLTVDTDPSIISKVSESLCNNLQECIMDVIDYHGLVTDFYYADNAEVENMKLEMQTFLKDYSNDIGTLSPLTDSFIEKIIENIDYEEVAERNIDKESDIDSQEFINSSQADDSFTIDDVVNYFENDEFRHEPD